MEYLTVEGVGEATYEIRRSVFICRVKGIEDFASGMEFVAGIAKKHGDATHNCYAVISADTQKFSDDGEPQGTAGQPILQTLKKRGLSNVAAVVTRYFGGVKLGAGGLVAAYTKAVSDCLDTTEIKTVKESSVFSAEVEYADYRAAAEYLNRIGTVTRTEFGTGTELEFAVPAGREEEALSELMSLTAGKAKPQYKETKFIKYNQSI